MSSRWEKQVLERIVTEVDSDAIGGRSIRSASLNPLIFDANPDSHQEPIATACREAYLALASAAVAAGRLRPDQALVKGWTLSGDIYSPKYRRFIEVDETQHFSKPRLVRLAAHRAEPWSGLYPARFWTVEYPRLMAKPRRDLDPPHRDEQRAYRDELRERLPVAYGLNRTIRIDEFTLAEAGLDRVASLIQEILETEM